MSGSVIKTFADERPLAYKLGISIHFSQAFCGSCRGKLYCSRDISKPQTIKFPRGTLPSLSSLFPLPIVPRALSFSFSPVSPQHKKASAEERGVTLQNKVFNNETPEFITRVYLTPYNLRNMVNKLSEPLLRTKTFKHCSNRVSVIVEQYCGRHRHCQVSNQVFVAAIPS